MAALFIWIFIFCSINVASSQSHRDRLKTALFTTAGYDADVRPYCGDNEAVNVTLDLAMRQLIELNEPLQIIKANIWIRMKWKDCRLVWNSSDYGGIGNIILPYDKIWVPDITLYDNTGETFFGKEDFTPNIYSDGTVYYNFPSVVDNRCVVDVSHFPYDSQTCKFVFGSWAYHGEEVNFLAKNQEGDLSSLEQNVEWDIPSFPVVRHVVYYNCCPEPYPDVTFYLKMVRKPKFYIVNIIIPSFLITVMGVFGFLLPCESGEKVSLEITVMLSLAVFQILVADSLPPSAETIPYIAIYFDFSLFLVGYATVMSVVVNFLHYRGNEEIPRIIRRIFFDWLSRIVFIKAPKTNRVSISLSPVNQDDNDSENGNNNRNGDFKTSKNNGYLPTVASVGSVTAEVPSETEEHLEKIEKTLEHIDSQISRSEEWKILATIVDRVSCYLYIFIGVIGIIVLFSLLANDT